MRRRFRLLAAAVLVAGLMGAPAGLAGAVATTGSGSGGAAAAAPKCGGKVPTIVGTHKKDVIYGTPGADVIHGRGGADIIYGRGGADVICGGRGSDKIRGGAGADRLYGGSGNDELRGGTGADTLVGSSGADFLWGGKGADTLRGGTGTDRLWGGSGPDELWGGTSSDRLYGGSGRDVLAGGTGKDLCKGGSGADLADTACETLVSAKPYIPGPGHPVGPTKWGALVDRSGPVMIDDGKTHVLRDVRLLHGLRVEGEGTHVVMRNCVVVNPGAFWTILVLDDARLTMEDCQIGQSTGNAGQRGVGGDNVVLRRVRITGHLDGIKAGDDSLYEQVWIHSLRDLDGQPNGHPDGIQDDGGNSGWTLRYSRIEPEQAPGEHLTTSSVLIKSDLGPISDVLLEHNILSGGSYTLYSRKGNSHPAPDNVVVRHNGFGRGHQYGILSEEPEAPVTWTRNYWVDTGRCINKNGKTLAGTCR